MVIVVLPVPPTLALPHKGGGNRGAAAPLLLTPSPLIGEGGEGVKDALAICVPL
jgi:hypothetical protein